MNFWIIFRHSRSFSEKKNLTDFLNNVFNSYCANITLLTSLFLRYRNVPSKMMEQQNIWSGELLVGNYSHCFTLHCVDINFCVIFMYSRMCSHFFEHFADWSTRSRVDKLCNNISTSVITGGGYTIVWLLEWFSNGVIHKGHPLERGWLGKMWTRGWRTLHHMRTSAT